MIAGLWRAWSGLWGVLGAALLASAAGLLVAGAFDGPRVAAAARALRGDAPPAPVPAPPGEDESVRRGHEASLAARRAELDRLEARVLAGFARMEADRARAVAAPAASAAEPTSAAPVLARLDAGGVVDVLRGGDDASFARALRGLRPSLAAEVLEALRSDPALEAEFRKPGPGGRSRRDRILDEFRKGS